MAYAKFLTVQDVLDNTPIQKDVDADLINKFIDMAQDINIQECIGYSLYHSLMDKVATDTATGHYYTLLVDYIQKAQSIWVMYHILPYLNYHLTNKSVSVKSSEYSEAAELDKIIYLRKNVESNAMFYINRLTEYLANNNGNFPELYSATGIGRIQPNNSNTVGGMYLPKR